MTKTEQFNLVANHNPNLYPAAPVEEGAEVIDVALWPVVAWATFTALHPDKDIETTAWPILPGCSIDSEGWYAVDLACGIWTSSAEGQGTGGVESLKQHFQDRLTRWNEARQSRRASA